MFLFLNGLERSRLTAILRIKTTFLSLQDCFDISLCPSSVGTKFVTFKFIRNVNSMGVAKTIKLLN